MSFQVPLSSSPMAPSTPGSGDKRNRPSEASKSFGSNVSTTPAGLPPSSAGSFTPAGPPPASVFGSSQLGPGKTLFKGKAKPASIPKSSVDSSKLARFLDSSNFNIRGGNGATMHGALRLPDSSPPRHDYEDEDADEEGEDYEDDEMDENSEDDGQIYRVPLKGRTNTDQFPKYQSQSTFGSKPNGAESLSSASSPFSPSTTNSTQRGSKRSRGEIPQKSISGVASDSLQLAQPESQGLSIAQDLSKRLDAAPLEEPDDLILGTEDLVGDFYTATKKSSIGPELRASVLANTCERLCTLWNTCCDRDLRNAPWKDEVVMGIGPEEGAPIAHSATFLSTLLLSLYHPAAAKGGQALALSRLGRPSQSSLVPFSANTPLNPTAYPKILLDWINRHHNPYQAILSEVQNHKPNATAHEFFWDMVYKMVLRGRFADLIAILKEADFRVALTARDDGHRQAGYGQGQVDNINMVIGWAVQALQTCPALTDDDWHVHADSWTIFRKHIDKAMEALTDFAEGRDKDLDLEEPSFQASDFGLKSNDKDFSRSSRRAESRVPWSILQNLRTMYGMIRGGSLEISSNSEDWVEAAIALTVLWNGADDEIMAASQIVSKRSLKSSRARGLRLVDTDPGLAYRRRLAGAFARITEGPDGSDDPPMLPDTSKPLEVALSSIFEGDVDGAVGILRAMSLPISDAVAEIGTIGGWLQNPTLDMAMDELDEADMDLLSFEKSHLVQDHKVTRRSIMKDYAEELFKKHELTGNNAVVVSGWELSVAVLARLGVGNRSSPQAEIRKLLARLPLNSDARINRIMHICEEHGIPDEGRKLVEKYAAMVLDSSDDFGTALIYYARAHSATKIKGVLDLLISYSLLQSTSYPAQSALDEHLYSLLFAPQESLEHLSLLDHDGAVILHLALTGYASLRKFYDLRDEAANLPNGQVPTQKPISREKAAAAALVALISSAANSIHGGLYDETANSVIQVEGLLALLGEAMVFINQTPSLLTLPQSIALLKAIEDLSTVTPTIFNQCENFLLSTLTAFARRRGAPFTSPRQMLKKQISSITSGSSFSLIGSSLLDSQLVDAMDIDQSSLNSSQALTKSKDNGEVKRGWDWRSGVGQDAKGQDVLKILRLGLAKEIARHWMSGS